MKTLKEQLLLNSTDYGSALTQIRVNGKAFLTLSSKDISVVLENNMISSYLLYSDDYTVDIIEPTFEHGKLIYVINIDIRRV